jgi:O-acetyl-ADP-ribose deacetylase (regulator of RNase III)
MREISADAWSVDCDVLCITTNCTINGGKNVMGGGIAAEAARRFPQLPRDYGRMIRSFGHHCYLMPPTNYWHEDGSSPRPLLMFPTKNEVWEDSTITRIIQSVLETKLLADVYQWTNIALPRPGAGLGGLNWATEVKPALEKIIDDRFLIVSFPGER